MIESVSQVWLQLESHFGRRLRAQERDTWSSLVLLYVDKKLGWEGLVQTIEDAQQTYGNPVQRTRGRPLACRHHAGGSPHLSRVLVLTDCLVDHAERDAEVLRFRQEALSNAMLRWEDVQAWIIRQRERERHLSSVALEVPIAPDCAIHYDAMGRLVPDPPLSIGETHPAIRAHREALDYAIPGSGEVHRTPIAYGGVLARLQHLSLHMSRRYRWHPALATIFVLTGLAPMQQSIEEHYDWRQFETQMGSVTALSRIVLTVDPTVTPKEVAAVFQRARQDMLGLQWRELKDRQLALAHFTGYRKDTEPWGERMQAWNAEFPQWAYRNISNFKRDCHHAVEKLFAPIRRENLFPTREDPHAETPGE